MKKIHYTKPLIGELEYQYVNDAIRNGWGEQCYDYIYKFENGFSEYLGVKHSIATSSCTGALHMILSSLGVGNNDEVIMPDITWIATASPITYLGAKPVFVDVLKDTWCIDPAKIESEITDNTKAIIVVHLYGNLAEMDSIMKIARKYDLPVIEDAAEGIGSEYKGQKAGSIGDFGVFSFHGTKTITTGEGGMLVSSNTEAINKIKVLANHGRPLKSSKQFWCEEIGFKYKMSNLQAALGCAQLENITYLVERKREIFYQYLTNLKDLDNISMNPEYEGTKNAFWMPTLVFNPSLRINREDLLKELSENNIDARVFFYPVSSFPMFNTQDDNVVSYGLYENSINLPSYFEISADEIKKVCDVIKSFVLK